MDHILFNVEILSNEDREWHESFSLVLGPDDPVEAVLGEITMTTVTILDQEAAGSLILPAPPIVSRSLPSKRRRFSVCFMVSLSPGGLPGRLRPRPGSDERGQQEDPLARLPPGLRHPLRPPLPQVLRDEGALRGGRNQPDPSPLLLGGGGAHRLKRRPVPL